MTTGAKNEFGNVSIQNCVILNEFGCSYMRFLYNLILRFNTFTIVNLCKPEWDDGSGAIACNHNHEEFCASLV